MYKSIHSQRRDPKMNDMTIDVPITEASVEGEERCIPHHRLVLSKHQARKNRKASPGDDAKLRESIIRRGGLIHNIVVVIRCNPVLLQQICLKMRDFEKIN